MEKNVQSVKASGLHNDFSEQESGMTASAMPPKFALTADTATAEGSTSKGRKAVPFGGFGGDLELDESCTTTVLGRCMEGSSREELALNVDKPLGTNYFRYQPEAMVGKSKGGVNVLDVADRTYTWALNNAWLQAAVHRGDRIRFISDPADPTTMYRKGDKSEGLTMTGRELGVLMNLGHAPHEGSGVVQKGYKPADFELWDTWKEIGRNVVKEGFLADRDDSAYEDFLNAGQTPARQPKEVKSPSGEVLAVQTNFFGGKASPKEME